MKLVYCKDCKDLFKLSRKELRRCKCGSVSGRYRKDGKHAEVSESAVSIKIPNDSIKEAVHRMEQLKSKAPKSKDEDYERHSPIQAWARPNFGPGNHRTHLSKKRRTGRGKT